VSCEDHVTDARAVYDRAAQSYLDFVGTEISAATECPIDRSLIMAFIEIIKGQDVSRVADVGCGTGRVAALMAEHGLDVIGVDVSESMLGIARTAHPHIEFEEGQLDALPLGSGVLAGAVCWYSIIYTPPDRLSQSFDELARVLMPGGHVLLAFQAEGESMYREDAFGTQLPLTSYRHSVKEVATCLEDTGFTVSATVLRAPELEHETTAQGFMFAARGGQRGPPTGIR
jgi:ubiquinone/menaquinone biosynthesis C-methylase UbiE